jgi:hypothetical protein
MLPAGFDRPVSCRYINVFGIRNGMSASKNTRNNFVVLKSRFNITNTCNERGFPLVNYFV